MSQFDRIHRAGLFTHPAVDAAKFVQHEGLRKLVTISPFRRCRLRLDRDAVRRAGCHTHHAGDAFDPVLFVAIQAMNTSIVQRQIRFDFGILLSHRLPVDHMLKCRFQTLHDGRNKRGFPEADLRLLNPCNSLRWFCIRHRIVSECSREFSRHRACPGGSTAFALALPPLCRLST